MRVRWWHRFGRVFDRNAPEDVHDVSYFLRLADHDRYWDNVLLSMPEDPTRVIMSRRSYIAEQFNSEGAAVVTRTVFNETPYSPISWFFMCHVWFSQEGSGNYALRDWLFTP
jgi:hypothetical protein